MATQLLLVGRAREAEDVLLRALVINDSATWQHFSNLTDAQYVQGKRDDARATVDAFDRKFPGHPAASLARAWLAYADGDLSRADSVARAAAAAFASIPAVAQQAEQLSALVSATRGQVNDALSRWERLERVARDRGIARDALVSAANRASYVATLSGDRDRAAAMLDQARARYDLGALPPGDRPYDLLITVLARAGRTGEAARLLAEWVREVPPTFRFRPFTSLVRAEVALARGEHAQVVQAVEEARRGFGCPGCGLYELGMAYDALGRRDSALAAYEQGLDVPDSYRYAWEWGRQPFALKRAGELHEAAGNRDRAIARYSQFVELWANADPELQPIVRDVRSRIARLVAER